MLCPTDQSASRGPIWSIHGYHKIVGKLVDCSGCWKLSQHFATKSDLETIMNLGCHSQWMFGLTWDFVSKLIDYTLCPCDCILIECGTNNCCCNGKRNPASASLLPPPPLFQGPIQFDKWLRQVCNNSAHAPNPVSFCEHLLATWVRHQIWSERDRERQFNACV